jgi:hypothetical protein
VARIVRSHLTALAQEVYLEAGMEEAYGHFMDPLIRGRRLKEILAENPDLESIADDAREEVRAGHLAKAAYLVPTTRPAEG